MVSYYYIITCIQLHYGDLRELQQLGKEQAKIQDSHKYKVTDERRQNT